MRRKIHHNQFDRKGKLIVDFSEGSREEIEMAVIDSGAEDFEEEGGELSVYSLPGELEQVKKNLEAKNIVIKEGLLSWEPKNVIVIADKLIADKAIQLMETLDALDDVTSVYSNFDISKDIVE